MKSITKFFFYLILLSWNFAIYSQDVTNHEDYKMIFLEEKYHKEPKTKSFRINKTIFLEERGFEYDKVSGISYVKLSLLSKNNNYSAKELAKISEYESYESPSFLLFEGKKFRNKVFIWKIEGEFFSRMFIFNIEGTVTFLGEITIGVFCEPNCDTFNLSNTDISVKADDHSIEITFKGKTFFSTPDEVIQSKKGGRIIADNLTLSYFIDDL